jgi:hypothetical protein
MHRAYGLPDVRLGGNRDDVEIRMGGDQAQQLAACVSAGAGDRDSCSHLHDYAPRRNFMQTRVFCRPTRRCERLWI